LLAKRFDAKEDAMIDISGTTLLELTNATDLLEQMWSIFPALSFVLQDPRAPRSVLILAVEFLQEFVNHATAGVGIEKAQEDNDIPSARAILINIPDPVLERLIDLLYVPRLGPDSLKYEEEDPTVNIVTRVNFYKLLMSYDATVDTDVRDRSLEVLVPLLELDSPRMALRLGRRRKGLVRTRLYDHLVPIVAGQVGRSESSLLASQILKELAKAGEENKVGLLYIKERLIEMAIRDKRVAQLVWVHLFPVAKKNVSDSESSEEQEDAH